ncbi:dephospho-CoA kinase [Flavobacteriales bacterium]|nr:dephospho-CoA kinase [Flavobacteriales bacterium]
MKKIGLTGGIGVGKTFVAKLFYLMGIPVFNADIEAKKCMVEDDQLMTAVQLAFGKKIYVNGILQKEELAKIVFNNEVALAKLNALVHPVVKQKFEDWCKCKTAKIVIKEAAILFESGANLGLDAVICVSATETLRIARVQKRDESSVEDIKSRMNKQMTQAEKEKLSDFVIVNNGEKLLLPQLIKLLKEME